MKKSLNKIIGILLSLAMMLTMCPVGMVWATNDGSDSVNGTEASDISEASASDEEELDEDNALNDEENTTEDENNITEEQVEAEEIESLTADGISVIEDKEIQNGFIKIETGKTVKITATPDPDYELASIRALYSDGEEEYLKFQESGDDCMAEFIPSKECTITAFFMNTKVWDGSVDVDWYDPSKPSFNIGTPAQLAGLAAITNGMVDTKNTKEWMIKDNVGREFVDGEYVHKYISTNKETADLLTPNSDASVRDIVWRLPERKEHYYGSDDDRNDFKYRTVNITADINMDGDNLNWTPIGGKYAMNPDEKKDGEKAKVIDTRFQGVFNGNGHTITINCNRYSQMGYAYSWELGVIGYLGGGVDYRNGYPKDTYIEYSDNWVPTVRNLVVKGYVKGRRIVGGVVGRTGETNNGVLVERCANYATVEASDMRGCAGIVAAAWGKTIIRQCYNAGAIKSAFWEHGGIVGSNGYEGSDITTESKHYFGAAGADIYDCYNIGDSLIYDTEKTKYVYDGQEIGVDGAAFCKYEIANCYYYKAEDTEKLDNEGYSRGTLNPNAKAKRRDIEATSDMNSKEILDKLNLNGNVFVEDTNHINSKYNGGGPVLYFQNSAEGEHNSADVNVEKPAKGTISASASSDIAYGTTINLSKKADTNTRFYNYVINDGGETKETKYGDFYTVMGNDVTINANFGDNLGETITYITSDNEASPYYVEVWKIRNGGEEHDLAKPVVIDSEDEYALHDGDIIKIVPIAREKFKNSQGEYEPIHPDLKAFEYTGEFGDVSFEEDALLVEDTIDKLYQVTGDVEDINISFSMKKRGKRWTSVADTSWYDKTKKEFTISTAKELAGVAKLCDDEVTDFEGVTINLANDISLDNRESNSGDKYPSDRSWTGIGWSQCQFAGTFDGHGHKITNMYCNFDEGYCDVDNCGLFGEINGATIKNVTVEGGSYNMYDDEQEKSVVHESAFFNGATGGAIVGYAKNSTIDNCTSKLDMYEAGNCGGIVGEIGNNATVSNCTNYGNIDEKGGRVGGIVGVLDSADGSSIINCDNYGTVSMSSFMVGGIVGYAEESSATICKCTNYGSIVSNTTSLYPSYRYAVGGVLGFSETNVVVDKCVNRGAIDAKGKTGAVGGIIGCLTKGTLRNSYNVGEIAMDSTYSDAQMGGIANTGTGTSIATIANCYNAGKMTIGSNMKSSKIGGGFGYVNPAKSVVAKCYCTNTAVSGIGNKAGDATTLVTGDELRENVQNLGDEFVADLDNNNDGYPVFSYLHPEFNVTVGTANLDKVSSNFVNSIKVEFSGEGELDGYELWHSTSANGAYTRIYRGEDESFTHDSGLGSGTHFYKVRVYKNAGRSKYYSEFSESLSGQIGIGGASFSSLKNAKGKKAAVVAKATTGATGYQVQFTFKKTKTKKVKVKVKGKTKTKKQKVTTYQVKKTATFNGRSATVTKLKKGKTYYCRIRAFVKADGKTIYGGWSGYKSVKIKK